MRIILEGGVNLDCVILDVDEDWVLLRPGKKPRNKEPAPEDTDETCGREGDMLLRLEAVLDVRAISQDKIRSPRAEKA